MVKVVRKDRWEYPVGWIKRKHGKFVILGSLLQRLRRLTCNLGTDRIPMREEMKELLSLASYLTHSEAPREIFL